MSGILFFIFAICELLNIDKLIEWAHTCKVKFNVEKWSVVHIGHIQSSVPDGKFQH